jgi:putative ABC transport system permease protein
MRDDAAMPERSLRVRALAGSVLTVGGASSLIGGLLADGTRSGVLVGVGAVLTLVGVAVVSPVLAPLAVRVLAAPYRRLFGTVGRLARDNALRNPRRTATTAAALMIGMALVTGVTILASSTRASTASIVDNQLKADFVLDGGGRGGTVLPTAVADRVRAVGGVGSVAQLGFVPVVTGDYATGAIAIDGVDLAENVELELVAGAASALGPRVLLVDENVAADQGWAVGDTVELAVGISPSAPFRVGGVYAVSPTIGTFVVDRSSYEAGVPEVERGDFFLYVRAAAGADLAEVRAGLARAVKPFAIVSVQDREQFKDAQAAQVNIILYIIYGLLGLAVVIAILGIVNTLALSVFERTREIGLLGAIGMDRRQLKRLIRLESVIIAVFGASLGTAIGLFFGVALQRALAEDGLTELALPYGQLAAFLLAAGLVGVLAAV